MAVRSFATGFGGGFGSYVSKGQLCLCVGTNPTYEDGDVLVAMNRRRIRCCHAEHICHIKDAGFTSDGLRPVDALARDFREAVYQFRFERVSATEIDRVTIATDDRERFGPTPNATGKFIDVAQHIARNKLHPRHAIFGTPGAEIWYGGQVGLAPAKLDAIWTAIETKTPHREHDFTDWPFTNAEMQRFLVIDTDDFADTVAADLTAQVVDATDPDNPVIIKKRKHRIAWQSLRDVVPANVLNPAVLVDIRGRKHLRASIVEAKS